jgi:hypothetical protein
MSVWRTGLAIGAIASGVVATLVACSSDKVDAAPVSDAGSEAASETPDAAQDAAALDAGPSGINPYGKTYPTLHLGFRPRNEDAGVPGDVIPNLALPGYKSNDSNQRLVQLADFYDPEGRTHDIIAMIGAAAWDIYGQEMLNKLGAEPSRVAVLSVLVQGGTSQVAATQTDLSTWRSTYPWCWHGLDPSAVQTKMLYDAQAFPLTTIIDARTMEIVSSAAGALTDPKSDLESRRLSVKARPPAY